MPFLLSTIINTIAISLGTYYILCKISAIHSKIEKITEQNLQASKPEKVIPREQKVDINTLLYELCGDTPEETINMLINLFCGCMTEAVTYKITVDKLSKADADAFVHSAFGASIRSQQLAQEEMLEMVI